MELSDAETVFDRDPTLAHLYANPTSAHSRANQTQYLTAEEARHARNSSKTAVYSVLLTILALGLLGGGIWWFFRDSIREIYNPPKEVIRSSEAKKISSPLTPEQEDQIKKEITDFLNSWKTSIEKRDINDQMRHYAKTLESFYRDSDKDQNHVRAERLKAFERYTSLNLHLTNIDVKPESDRFATVIFDKNWVFSGNERFSSGGVQQEIGLVKSDGRWYIVIEKDLQIYNMNNNRQSQQPNNSNNSNQ